MDYLVSYAQNREDRILEAFFPDLKEGFYVDVGANHPIHESVTKLFYDKGWSGINIEPNVALFDLLNFDRPRDQNLKIGASNQSGELEFTQYLGDGLSTFSDETKEDYENSNSGFFQEFAQVVARYKVPVKKLSDIFDELKVTKINFMKVDVEGFEYEVLEGNDWNRYRPEVICIEANHVYNDWRPLLAKQKYGLAFFDGLNNYYIAEEAPDRLKEFSYPERMLLQGLIVSLPVVNYIHKIEMDNKLAELKLRQQSPSISTATTVQFSTRRSAKRGARLVAKKINSLVERRLLTGGEHHVMTDVNTSYVHPLDRLVPMQLRALSKSYRQGTLTATKTKRIIPDPLLPAARRIYAGLAKPGRRGRV